MARQARIAGIGAKRLSGVAAWAVVSLSVAGGCARGSVPAFLDGRMFVRTTTGISCYDLRKK